MARLRATASAARSVLDGREHDGMLSRVGGRSASHQNKIKKSANRQVKKRAHAHRSSSAPCCGSRCRAGQTRP